MGSLVETLPLRVVMASSPACLLPVGLFLLLLTTLPTKGQISVQQGPRIPMSEVNRILNLLLHSRYRSNLNSDDLEDAPSNPSYWPQGSVSSLSKKDEKSLGLIANSLSDRVRPRFGKRMFDGRM